MSDGMIGTLLFVGAAITLVIVVIAMVMSKRVRSEARTREGLFGSQPWWVRVIGLLILVGGAYVVIQR